MSLIKKRIKIIFDYIKRLNMDDNADLVDIAK